MNKNEMMWYAFERDAIPAALNGTVDTRRHGPAITFGAPRPRPGDIVIGFCENPVYQVQITPQLVVMNEESAADVFSWLATYAPDIFPLSQFARVITDEDWGSFSPREYHDFQKYCYQDRWASLILGEMLAQGDSDTDLANIPFSRASACFSTAIARSALIYPKQSIALTTCISRLRKIEADGNFVKRPMTVSELARGWGMLQHHEFRPRDFHDANEPLAIEAVDILLSHHGVIATAPGVQLLDFPGLRSNSIEERVQAFQGLISAAASTRTEYDTRLNAIVASAAFLVGRGTSHLFLLRRASKHFSSAVYWFGALAALAGPRCWDVNWTRLVKGIEKHLHSQFRWEDPAIADLCWHEYAWLGMAYHGESAFESISKNSPNVLSVEIIPGASCQMRLATSVGRMSDHERSVESAASRKSERELELEAIVEQLLRLATKAQELVVNTKVRDGGQESLFEGDPVLSSKAPKKKARGGTGFSR